MLGATLVEFALIAPVFFFTILGVFAGSAYVLEAQVANQAAQAAARWAVASSNLALCGSEGCIVTSESPVITMVAPVPPNGGFYAGEVGQPIFGPDVPPGTTVEAVETPTELVMSQAASLPQAVVTQSVPLDLCPSPVAPPDGGSGATLLSVAGQAAGPFAASLAAANALTDGAAPTSTALSGAVGCEVTVTLPFVDLGGFSGLTLPAVKASAVDYVT